MHTESETPALCVCEEWLFSVAGEVINISLASAASAQG